MQAQDWMVLAAALVAVVALASAVATMRSARRTRREVESLRRSLAVDRGERVPGPTPEPAKDPIQVVTGLPSDRASVAAYDEPAEGERVIVTRDGRTIVLPTQDQVVTATLGRPMIRGAVVSHGLLHALRPESRDRIRAIVRREFRRRKKERLAAGRRAARSAPVGRAQSQAWLGTETEGRTAR